VARPGLEPGTPRFSGLRPELSNKSKHLHRSWFLALHRPDADLRYLRTFPPRSGTELVPGTRSRIGRPSAGHEGVIKDWPTSAYTMPLSLAQAMRLSDVNEHAAKNLRCCAHEEPPGMAPSCRICARTSTTPPGLSDSAAREAEDEDLAVGDGFAGWRQAHVFAAVGSGNHIPADDLVPSAIKSSTVTWRSG